MVASWAGGGREGGGQIGLLSKGMRDKIKVRGG